MKKNIVTLLILFLFIWSSAFSEDVKIWGFPFTDPNASVFAIPLINRVNEEYSRSVKINGIDSTQASIENQVVIGHSEGGLTSIGYVNQEYNLAPHEIIGYDKIGLPIYKVNTKVKALITVDSPIMGFAGMDSGYSYMRQKVLDATGVNVRGLSSALMYVPGGILISSLTYLPPDWQMSFLNWIIPTPFSPLISRLVQTPNANNDVQRIVDLGKGSTYVQANVGTWYIEKVRYQSGTGSYIAVNWYQGWLGIPYPVFSTVYYPIYAYYDRPIFTPKYRTDIPIGHVVGMDKDPLRMAESNEGTARVVIGVLATGEFVAGGIHSTFAVSTWPIGTALFAYHSFNCYAGADWLSNYNTKWGDLIGGQASDGLITEGTQALPGTPQTYIRKLSVDHQRSGSDPRIWGDSGKINEIKTVMTALGGL